MLDLKQISIYITEMWYLQALVSVPFILLIYYNRDNLSDFINKRTPRLWMYFLLITFVEFFVFVQLRLRNWGWIGLLTNNVFGRYFLLGQYSHLFSLFGYGCLMIYLLEKWKNQYASAILTVFVVGFVEFSYIPQQIIKFGWIIPYLVGHYVNFLILLVPFILTRKYFRFTSTFYKIFAVHLIFYCAVFLFPPLNEFSITYWDWNARTFLWRLTFSESGISSTEWLFQIVLRLQKTILTIAFVGVERRHG